MQLIGENLELKHYKKTITKYESLNDPCCELAGFLQTLPGFKIRFTYLSIFPHRPATLLPSATHQKSYLIQWFKPDC